MKDWAQGIREEIKAQGANHGSFNFIYECLDQEAREFCEATLKPEDNPRKSIEEYLGAVQRKLETQNQHPIKRYGFLKERYSRLS